MPLAVFGYHKQVGITGKKSRRCVWGDGDVCLHTRLRVKGGLREAVGNGLMTKCAPERVRGVKWR